MNVHQPQGLPQIRAPLHRYLLDKSCPAIAMLRKQMPIVSTFETIEAEPADASD